MAEVPYSGLVVGTAIASGDKLAFLDISDITQGSSGSLLAITITNFFATIPVPIVTTSSVTGTNAIFSGTATVGGSLVVTYPVLGTETGVVATNYYYDKPERYGVVMGLTTDQTSLFQNMLTSLFGAYSSTTSTTTAGGRISWSSGYCLLAGQITWPSNTAAIPSQPAYIMRGTGMVMRSYALTNPPAGGTILDCRYDGGTAKWLANGLGGALVIQDLTLADFSTNTTTPFIQTRLTATVFERVAFCGNPSKTGVACNQDAVIYGATGVAYPGTDSGFQGYISRMVGCEFEHIRRMALITENGNGIVLRDNHVTFGCGSNLTNGACIELAGTLAGGQAIANLITGNIFECAGYPYIIKSEYASFNTFAWNGFYDADASVCKNFIRFEAHAGFNTVHLSYADTNHTSDNNNGVSDVNLTNTIHSNQQAFPSILTSGFTIPDISSAPKGKFTTFGPNIVGPHGIIWDSVVGSGVNDQAWSIRHNNTTVVTFFDFGSGFSQISLNGTATNIIQADTALRIESATGTAVILGDATTSTDFVLLHSTGLALGVDFKIASTKFTVAAASGNTVIAGTLNVTGTITGTLSGNVTGNLTGNVTGNTSGSAGSVAAANITGTTLASGVVTSSLTSVGTLTSLLVSGGIRTNAGFNVSGSAGVNGTFLDMGGNTITVAGGIIVGLS